MQVSCNYNAVCFDLFCFNDAATTELYTLSLHDALPISDNSVHGALMAMPQGPTCDQLSADPRAFEAVRPSYLAAVDGLRSEDTRLNSSHPSISYAVFCLKKKKTH